MIEPQVQWMTASPIWAGASEDPAAMQTPALLRFASDNFMQDLGALLDTAPDLLAGMLARPESFRARGAGSEDDWEPQIAQLKLYQPAHGHFYLIAASLVCRMSGLPDKVVDPSQAEQAAFVLRRIGSGGQEMAWSLDPTNLAQGKGWRLLSPGSDGDYRRVDLGEELMPMLPVTFNQAGHRRRLLIGLVPTASRDTYQAGKELSPFVSTPDPRNPVDPRLEEFDAQVISPFRELKATLNPPNNVSAAELAKINAEREAREREASQFLLLDFAELLSTQLGVLWQAIQSGNRPTVAALASLYDTLGNSIDNGAGSAPIWRQAMLAAINDRDRITGELPVSTGGAPQPAFAYNLRRTPMQPDTLRAQLEAALRLFPVSQSGSGASQPANAALRVPKLDDGSAGTQYLLRCVYRRPLCAPLKPDVVSRATRPFSIASFFDFDAPARPIRINMPLDTSVAGLRKFRKNVSFILSDKLRQQMNSVSDLKKVMDGNLSSGQEFDLGVICSFSIPIITICALVVLLIFISLLNIVFWWLPFFRICLPIGLKGK